MIGTRSDTGTDAVMANAASGAIVEPDRAKQEGGKRTAAEGIGRRSGQGKHNAAQKKPRYRC